MSDDILDKDDPYRPIMFTRNYFDEPTKVQPYWIKSIYVKNMVGVGRPDGTALIDVLGKPAITGPNGYGKSLLLKLVNAVLEIAYGHSTISLETLIGLDLPAQHLFDIVTVTTVDDNVYSLHAVDWSTGSFVFYCNETEYYITQCRLDETAVRNPPKTACEFLPTGRVAEPIKFICELAAHIDHNIDYGFLNKWYNLMIRGEESSTESANRYNNIPCDNARECGKWLLDNHLSFGEVELLMQLMAMSSGCKIVLVDAAEIGLHLSAQVSYMNLLSWMYQNGVQVLFTTHSPQMFDLNFSNSNDLFDVFGRAE
jgi:energy-coupling factor transporter ATP-binding protein EcfA2